MGLGRSSVLSIGSNPTEASCSGWIGGESDSLVVVVHRVADECLKHSRHTRVCLTVLASFYI